MNLDGMSFPSNEDEVEIISQPQFLAKGAFHFVFLIETKDFSSMVYKVAQQDFNGNIGPYSVDTQFSKLHVKNSEASCASSVNIDRGIRLWNEVNGNVFLMKFGQGLLAPYFDSDWGRPSDNQMADIVSDIYGRTHRIFMDVFSENVLLSPDNDSYVVIDPDYLMKFSRKMSATKYSDDNHENGYESDATLGFQKKRWAFYFLDYSRIYPKTMKQILDLLNKENELSMISPANQLHFYTNKRMEYYECLNLFALLARKPVDARYLITSEYIVFCCCQDMLPYLYLSTIKLFLNSSLVTFPAIESLISEVLKRIKSNDMDNGQLQRYLSILYRVNEFGLTRSEEQKLYVLIAPHASCFPGALLEHISSLQQSLPESVLEYLVLESSRLTKACVRNILSCSDRLPLTGLIKLLNASLFDKHIRNWVRGLYNMIAQSIFLHHFADYLCDSVMNQHTMSLHTVDLKLMIGNNSSPWVGQNSVEISNHLAPRYVSQISTQLRNNSPGLFSLNFGVETGHLVINQLNHDSALKLQTEKHFLREYRDCYEGKLNVNTFNNLCLALLVTQNTAQAKGWWWHNATGYSRWHAAQKVIRTSRQSFGGIFSHKKPASFFGRQLVMNFKKQDDGYHILRRFNRRHTSTQYSSMDSLCHYLFDKRYSAISWGWWWQSSTGFASWQAIEYAIGIKRINCLRCSNWRELKSTIIDAYCNKYKSLSMTNSV